jgi:heme exporter protein B
MRECRLACRFPQELLTPLLFFVIVITLFPLAISPAPNELQILAPGVIWVAALLATLLSLERLFRADLEDGSLEQLLLSPRSLTLLIFIKVVSHWLLCGLPLIILSPILATMLTLQMNAMTALILSLLLGTPILSLLGAMGEALTLGLRGGSILLTLIVLPMTIPVLIFASSAVIAAQAGLPYIGNLALLAACLVLAMTLVPMAIVAALKLSVNY